MRNLLPRFPRRLLGLGVMMALLGMMGRMEQAGAEVTVLDEEEMLLASDLVALVDIVDLSAAEPGAAYSDLTVRARLTQVLKGVTMKTDLEFRVDRDFPCAAFDVSTGMHLVFLKRDKNGKWTGSNWFMSYVYLGGKKAKWYDRSGVRVESGTPDDLIKRIKERIEKDKAAEQPEPKPSARLLQRLRKPTT